VAGRSGIGQRHRRAVVVGRYFADDRQPGEFMLTTADLNSEGRASLAATTHVDGTTRPQVVQPSVSPLYHRLISHLGTGTGVPAVLNTSFNLAGSPIVDNEMDAIRTFLCSGLDALVIENYVFTKA
jgi:carbamoyltransferase